MQNYKFVLTPKGEKMFQKKKKKKNQITWLLSANKGKWNKCV